jgi:hypothetical protein
MHSDQELLVRTPRGVQTKVYFGHNTTVRSDQICFGHNATWLSDQDPCWSQCILTNYLSQEATPARDVDGALSPSYELIFALVNFH